jgi:outer membrane lipoprotein SlyB
MSSPVDEPNPFAQPPMPSAWQAIVAQRKQEQQQRHQALVGLLLEFAGVVLGASALASIGLADGAFLRALKGALFGSLCGGALCAVWGMIGSTGALRPSVPVTLRGAPMVFPMAQAGGALGIFTFTILGAAIGAEVADKTLPTLWRAILGGIAGLVPACAWWVYIRRRAGKRNGGLIAVLVCCFALACVAGAAAYLSGSLQPEQRVPPRRADCDTLYPRASDRLDRGDWAAAMGSGRSRK